MATDSNSATGLEAQDQPQGPRLWFTYRDIPVLRERAARAPLKLIAEAALKAANQALEDFRNDILFRELEDDAGEVNRHNVIVPRLEACATAYLLTGNCEYAACVNALALHLSDELPGSDLGIAFVAQWTVRAYDWCRDGLGREQQHVLAERIRNLALRLVEHVSKDNPDNPFNNWWGVTHSSCGLCALATYDVYPELKPLLELEMERTRSYLMNYGDQGNYYEGTGYGFYALSHWAPFLLACRHFLNVDLADWSPGIAHMPAFTSLMTVFREQVPDSSNLQRNLGIGMRVFWNDDGGWAPRRGVPPLLLGIAQRGDLAMLRWMFDRLCGELGDRSWLEPGDGFLWSLLYYPADIEPVQPTADVWSLCRVDTRTGLALFRNRFMDKDDCVLGVSARAYHGGGHNHEDCGSFRFMGMGQGWATCGGQAKPAPWYQGAILKDGGLPDIPAGKISRLGKISYLRSDRNGAGSVSLRLDKTYHAIRVDRHFAVHYPTEGSSLSRKGVVAILGILDQLWDEDVHEWTWTMCHERALAFQALPESNGFQLKAPDERSVLTGIFASPASLEVMGNEGPASERTFSNGAHVAYPGARWISASTTGTKVDFFCVMTLHTGPQPEVEIIHPGTKQYAVPQQFGGNLPSISLSPQPIVKVEDQIVWFQQNRWFEGPLRIEGACG